jgi:hypothetical protein
VFTTPRHIAHSIVALQPVLSVPEVAESLAVSDTTIESDWRFARAWLRGQLGGTSG